jgi:putative transposase
LLKHQLLISNRARRRAPNLNSFDRLLLGLGSLFVAPNRIPKLAVILKPRTLFRFHEALKKRKYRMLFSSGGQRRPGPKGPSKELIDAMVEIKRRNPRFGCPRIAQEIAHAFGIDIDKDIVRRVLAKHYRPASGTDGPSWLSFIGQLKGQPVERRSVPLRINTPAQPLGYGSNGRVHRSDHRLRR